MSGEQPTFLQSWSQRVSQYSQFFQIHTVGAREDLRKLQESPLTGWKDVSKRQDRYGEIDSLELRRQLGEITPGEVSEVNRVFGGNLITGYQFTRASNEPALLKAWHKGEILAMTGASFGMAGYGRFVRGYNNLWLLAAVLPIATLSLVQGARQPTMMIDNAYRYLIAKRAATAEFEANSARLMDNEWAKSAEFANLSSSLSSSGQTLYDLEARLVQQIESGKFGKQ